MTPITTIVVALALVPAPRPAPGPARGTGPQLPASSAGPSVSQGIQGVVLDQSTGDPIRSARVTLRGRADAPSSALAAETDDRGFFRLRTAEPGTFLLSAHALGYADLANREVVVAQGSITVLEIRMTPEALELEPVVVTAEPRNFYLEMEGFYKRQTSSGRAVFLTPEVIEARHPRQVRDLIQGIPGVRERVYNGQRVVYFQGGIRMSGDSTPCWPVVWVDRALVSMGGDLGADPLALNNAVAATDVAAIEVYRGVVIPQEFRTTNAACGVVVIWTHRGR